MSVPLFDALDAVAVRVEAAAHVLLFCDFDGALAPVYDHPGTATLSAEVSPLLAELSAGGRVTVVVVSGRSAADLRARADVPGLIVAGDHGLEIAGPGWEYVDPAVAQSAALVPNLSAALTLAAESVAGAVVEEKGFSVSVRFRDVPPDQQEALRAAVHGVLASSSHPFILTVGPMSYDIRPRVYWHKGETVKWIAARVGQPEGLVVFIGGDPTDEEAFAVLPDGVTVRVGTGADTAAKYHLEGPDGVRTFLAWLRDHVRPRPAGT